MTLYHPEMREEPPAGALLHVDHVINDTWSAEWHPDREAEVLALFRALRIRPRRLLTSERLDGSTKRWSLISGTAWSKLCHRPDVAAEILLD